MGVVGADRALCKVRREREREPEREREREREERERERERDFCKVGRRMKGPVCLSRSDFRVCWLRQWNHAKT